MGSSLSCYVIVLMKGWDDSLQRSSAGVFLVAHDIFKGPVNLPAECVFSVRASVDCTDTAGTWFAGVYMDESLHRIGNGLFEGFIQLNHPIV